MPKCPCPYCKGKGRVRKLNIAGKAVDFVITGGLSLFGMAFLDDPEDPANWERCWRCRGAGELTVG